MNKPNFKFTSLVSNEWKLELWEICRETANLSESQKKYLDNVIKNVKLQKKYGKW